MCGGGGPRSCTSLPLAHTHPTLSHLGLEFVDIAGWIHLDAGLRDRVERGVCVCVRARGAGGGETRNTT